MAPPRLQSSFRSLFLSSFFRSLASLRLGEPRLTVAGQRWQNVFKPHGRPSSLFSLARCASRGGWMPKQSRKRRKAEGKSRPLWLPTERRIAVEGEHVG